MTFFNNLTIFSLLITPYFTLIDAAIFYVTNNCSYTVWAAANPGGGRMLYPSQKWVFNTDPNFREIGRIWGRTNCDANNKCESGDCGGVLDCNESSGAPPVTLAEYAFNQSLNMDFFDISLVDGFNVPMEFSPATSTSGCTPGAGIITCGGDIINRLCPTELRDPGGCLHPCTVFNNDQFCCTGRNSTPTNCSPTAYSKIFKDACPNVYTYAFDDVTNTFTCPTGTDYKVVFCP